MGQDALMHLVDMGGQAVDTSSPMGRFFLTMLASVAEMERGLIELIPDEESQAGA